MYVCMYVGMYVCILFPRFYAAMLMVATAAGGCCCGCSMESQTVCVRTLLFDHHSPWLRIPKPGVYTMFHVILYLPLP